MKKSRLRHSYDSSNGTGNGICSRYLQAGIEDKTLIVGFDAEYPPYGYMDENGEYTGFDLELAQAVCDIENCRELEKKTNQLGFQGYGTEFRIYRLYLEWIYYERKRR